MTLLSEEDRRFLNVSNPRPIRPGSSADLCTRDTAMNLSMAAFMVDVMNTTVWPEGSVYVSLLNRIANLEARIAALESTQ